MSVLICKDCGTDKHAFRQIWGDGPSLDLCDKCKERRLNAFDGLLGACKTSDQLSQNIRYNYDHQTFTGKIAMGILREMSKVLVDAIAQAEPEDDSGPDD